MTKNRLAKEKSPYLLLHADNPVDWYPWGEEAFEKARKEDRPIFLSIGYSTCHWCHVMERESFADPEVAKLMNEAFVNIKVDREERPDLDGIYMRVCQIATGGGGWPLTIVMTPDKRPFFAGTYFPKKGRFGRPGIIELVPKIKDIWENQRGEALNAADSTVTVLKRLAADSPGKKLDGKVISEAYRLLSKSFDEEHAGFGNAPKFPSPHNLLFLLRYWNRTKDAKALEMVERTLSAMRLGGMYDQVGHGYHRYSTDTRWHVPHFEKMLYDQAMLVMAYTEAYQATGKEEYARTVNEVLGYVLRDMTSDEGGFYSAEDADSEGEEGKFYVWTRKEIIEVLGKEDGELIVDLFNVSDAGSFKDEVSGETKGVNILFLERSVEEEVLEKVEGSRKKLLERREMRVRPSRDDKVLTDWNGLMIVALAKAYQVFMEPSYLEAAKKAADFILDNMRRKDGRLLHRYRDGEADVLAFIEDHAFLMWGLLELYEASFDTSYLGNALWLNKDMLEHFWDHEVGGFYATPDDGEELLVRQKEMYDGAVPSGNSVAMLCLVKLGRLVYDPEAEEGHEDRADKIGRSRAEKVREHPTAHTFLLCAVDMGIGPSYELVVVGDRSGEDTKDLLKAVRREFMPNKVIVLRATDEDSSEIDNITGFTKDQTRIDGHATAYVCLDHGCKEPTIDIGKTLELLRTKETPGRKSVKIYKVG